MKDRSDRFTIWIIQKHEKTIKDAANFLDNRPQNTYSKYK